MHALRRPSEERTIDALSRSGVCFRTALHIVRSSAQGIERDAVCAEDDGTAYEGATQGSARPSTRLIHPSTPEGASWGSRHAQPIGRKSDSRSKAGGIKDRKDASATVVHLF